MIPKTRSFLKWAGGKYRCLDKLRAVMPRAQRLIEPFTGSGAVFLNCHYQHYLLGEQNKDLIALFQQLQAEGPGFIDYCASFFIPDNNTAEQYYAFRQKFNQSQQLRQRAALFLYLNRHGYNGLCRYNQSGIFNVPFGRYRKPYFPFHEMTVFHEKSQQANFLHSDFRDTFAEAQSGDLIYCDPPYVPLSKSASFSSYTATSFGETAQIELARLAKLTAQKGVTVIISNHDTPFTRHHYQDAEIISFPVNRPISCSASNRHAVQEVLAVFAGI